MNYDNNNTGALFHQKDKRSEKAPDYTGECEVNGVKMEIAGWRKTSQKGTAYLWLKFQPAGERVKGGTSTATKPKNQTDEDLDSIPF